MTSISQAALEMAQDISYEEGLWNGHKQGYEDGYKAGYKAGYDEGREAEELWEEQITAELQEVYEEKLCAFAEEVVNSIRSQDYMHLANLLNEAMKSGNHCVLTETMIKGWPIEKAITEKAVLGSSQYITKGTQNGPT